MLFVFRIKEGPCLKQMVFERVFQAPVCVGGYISANTPKSPEVVVSEEASGCILNRMLT